MNTISRGIRNAFRNSIRAFSIVMILGLSIGLSLAMLVARAAVEDKIESVKTSIGNTITVTPAGAQGFQGGGEPLTNDQLAKVATIPNVTKVTQTLSDRLTTENTNLVSAIEPGTLGNRQSGNSGIVFQRPPSEAPVSGGGASDAPFTRTFTPPVTITGVNETSSPSVYGGDSVTFTSGKAFDASKDADVAVVGETLAKKNSLAVGSTFTAYGKTLTVVGIYDTGTAFSNAGLVVPLITLQRLSDQPDSVTSAAVTVDSIDNLTSVVTDIESTLGDAADVVSSQETVKQAVEPLESVKTISTFSLIGALAAGAVIILLTMVMIVRERRREIGVFKAIGASNIKIMFQFMSEAVTLTFIGLLAGLIIGALAANPVTKVLVNNSSTSTQTEQQPAEGPRMFGGPAVSIRSLGNNSLANVRNIQASVGTDMLGYGLGMAFVIAIVGSAIPTFLISKVRPAEVMRAE